MSKLLRFYLSSTDTYHHQWEFNIKQPIVIDMVDEEAKLKGFLDSLRPMLEELPKGFLITMQEVDVVMQKAGPKK